MKFAMISSNLKKKKKVNLCAFGLKSVYNFTYVHVYVHVGYVAVLQVDEGAPIPFWHVKFIIKTCYLTMK